MSVPSLVSTLLAPARSHVTRVPQPRVHGRHRLEGPRLGTTLDVVGRLGSLVTLTALLILAGAVGSLFDGVSAPDDASTASSVMFDDAAR